MKKNKHSSSIPDAVLEQAITKVEEAHALIRPYITPLTKEEKRRLPKMGDKTLGFLEKAFHAASDNPNLVPPFLSMVAFGIDFKDAHGLWPLYNRIQQLLKSVGDTHITASSEAYQLALMFYNSAKAAALNGVEGAQAVYDELKKRFPGIKKQLKESEQ